jgi:preprotein translocase subunit SecD
LRGYRYLALLPAILLAQPGIAASEPLKVELVSAVAGFDQRTREPIVSFKMNAASARAFAELTQRSVGKPMEFRVDGRVVMKPVIREPILGGGGQISGAFSVDEAKALAERLASGAAKLELEVVE